jgi:hypothetical protein
MDKEPISQPEAAEQLRKYRESLHEAMRPLGFPSPEQLAEMVRRQRNAAYDPPSAEACRGMANFYQWPKDQIDNSEKRSPKPFGMNFIRESWEKPCAEALKNAERDAFADTPTPLPKLILQCAFKILLTVLALGIVWAVFA